MERHIIRGASFVAATLLLACEGSSSRFASVAENSTESAQANPAKYEWRSYLAGTGHSHYSSLDQINTNTVDQLPTVWRFDAGESGGKSTLETQCNPLIIKGILYCSSPNL